MSKITPSFYETIECVKLLKKKIKNDPYIGTVFENARFLTSRAKGAFFEKLTKEYFKKVYGVSISKPKSSEHDGIFNNTKVEIKGSTLWLNAKGEKIGFRWQQIRDQDYSIMIFLAMYPDCVKFYYATKKDLINNLDPYKNNQHGGKNINSGTMFIDGYPEDFYWMKEVKDVSFIK
jgi:hypothetical protein